MARYLSGKRDANEAGLCDLILAIGGSYTKMHESAGFDLVVVFHNGAHIVEVKNGKYWKLTPGEKKKKAEVEAAGGVYNIVENDDDILKLRENFPK